ncbi:MAG: phospholipase [Oligoflexia bacterium]|nr:MAG: phospholipase [Oligoflexia bacterium]
MKYLIPFILFLSVSCTTTTRQPAGWSQAYELQKLYDLEFNYRLALEEEAYFKRLERLSKKYGQEVPLLAPDHNLVEKYKKELAQFKDKYQQEYFKKYGSENLPQSAPSFFQKPWRTQRERLSLRYIEHFDVTSGISPKLFPMDLSNAKSYELEIENTYFSRHNKQATDVLNEKPQPYFVAQMSCDGPFEIKESFSTKSGNQNQPVQVRIYDNAWNGQRVHFYPDLQRLTACSLEVKNPDSPELKYAVRLVSHEKMYPNTLLYQNYVDGCLLPSNQNLKGVERFFLTPDYYSMTCPQPVYNIQTLENPLDGLRAKLKSLLGYDLTDAELNKQDPYLDLDFSRVPQLDEIMISYLVFRGDYSGTLIRRALEHHAAKGTLIRILISDSIALDKDREIFSKLISQYPNIKLLEFRWKAPDWASLGEIFDQLHRSMHTKLLIALSNSDPSQNSVIIGGRNIHDGFSFKTAPDLTKYPDLVHWGKDESFAHWRDFELKITDQLFAHKVASHFMTLWEMDADTFFQRSVNVNMQARTPVNSQYFNENAQLVRHFTSVPYKDSLSLEEIYTQAFASAEKEILISTPYFHLTEKISNALLAAANRGVKVTVLTRLDLDGDTIDFVLSDVNKKTVNKFYQLMSIYEYTEPKVILHTKAVIIDDKLVLTGGVNLNKRTFLHDLENGVMIYSPEFSKKMKSIYSEYMKTARKIDSTQKIKWLNKIILGIPLLEEAL